MKEQPFNQKCVSKLLTGSALQVLAALMQTLKEEIYIVQNRPQPRRTGGRENHFSFMHRERRKSALTSSPTGLLPLPVPSVPSPPPPPILSLPLAPEPPGGFSAATATLFRPSRLLASVRLSALSFAAYSYPWLPPPPTPHCLYSSDSCHCDSCSVCVCVCVLGCCVRKGSLLPCCSVYACVRMLAVVGGGALGPSASLSGCPTPISTLSFNHRTCSLLFLSSHSSLRTESSSIY